jgi:hypothetical protein
MMGKTVRTMLAGLVVLAAFSLAPAASANDADVIKEGSCSGASDWKLKLSPEDGNIEVEFEVDSNVNGQTWHVKIFQNGNRIFNKDRTTKAPSGSFEVRVVANDTAGVDHFKGRAKNDATGELCVGTANF